MPRRKTAEVEIMPTEDGQLKQRSRKKLVDAKHTVVYQAPVPIEIEDDSDEGVIIEDDFEGIEEKPRQRRKKTEKDERDELRRDMDKSGVVPTSALKLSIEKYRHSDSDDSGTLADKDHCTKYACDRNHILNDDYPEVARKYGPGRYWFTLRLNNKIVKAWDRVITSAIPAATNQPFIQNAIPGDPTSPQIVFQMPDGGTQQVPQAVDPLVQLRGAFKLVNEFKKDLGLDHLTQQQQPAPALEPKVAALQLIADNPAIMDKIGDGLSHLVGGRRGSNDDPSPWAVAMELVKSGQAAEVVRVAIDAIFNGMGGLFPKQGGNNGTPQMASTSQPQGQGFDRRRPQLRQDAGIQTQPQVATDQTQGVSEVGGVLGEKQSPEDQIVNQLLNFVIDQCKAQTKPEVVADSIDAYLGQVAEQAPFVYPGVIKQVELFVSATPEAALEFVKGLEGGDAVVSLPHAKEWTTKLQELLKEGEEGEETNE